MSYYGVGACSHENASIDEGLDMRLLGIEAGRTSIVDGQGGQVWREAKPKGEP